jgi:hypothetical protein
MRCIALEAGCIASPYAEMLDGMAEFSVLVADQRHSTAEAQLNIVSGVQPIGAGEKDLADRRRALPPLRRDLFSRDHHVLLDGNDAKHDLSWESVAGPAREAAVAAEP